MLNRIQETLEGITLIYLLILVFGAYSFTRLVVTDSFPWAAKPREWIFDRFPPVGHVTERKIEREGIISMRTANGWYVQSGHWLGEMLSCPWCAGFYVSLAVSVAYLFAPVATLAVLFPMALRASVGVIAYRNGG